MGSDYDSDSGGRMKGKKGKGKKSRKGKKGKKGKKGQSKGLLKQQNKMKAASREYKKLPKSQRTKAKWQSTVRKHLKK